METCKLITDWPRYEVSNLGFIRNVLTGRIRKPSKRRHGYLNVMLTREDGARYSAYVHRLVAKEFIPNPLCLDEVNHLDGNPGNNAASNLEWTTHRDNIRHAIKRRGGMWKTGGGRSCIPYIAKSENKTLGFKSLAQASNHFNKKYSTFAPMVNRAVKHGWLCLGYHWSRV
jgi:HNH endonuclease/NUMOD4 motif